MRKRPDTIGSVSKSLKRYERVKRRFPVTLLFLLAAAGPVHADPGLSSLEGLLPLYILAFAAFILGVYVLPIWLTFRAKKMHAKGGLSRRNLLLLTVPAGLVGAAGVADVASPLSTVSGIVGSEDLGMFRALYWGYFGLCAMMIYLAASAYRRLR